MTNRSDRRKANLEERVSAFRDLLYVAVRKADEQGKVLRAYEGSVSLQWPPVVQTKARYRVYTLRMSCSVLGGHTAHFSWTAHSWPIVFKRAMADVQEWIDDLDRDSKGETDVEV